MKRQHVIGLTAAVGMVLLCGCTTPKSAPVALKGPTDLDYEADGVKTVTLEMKDLRDARFCELFFIRVKGDQTIFRNVRDCRHQLNGRGL